MTLKTILASALVTASVIFLAGCAATEGAGKAAAGKAPTTVLVGSNGDMSKYLGTWVSSCGHGFRLNTDGSGAFTSAVNSFRLTRVAGRTIYGTLTVDSYASRDCTGSPTQAADDIVLSYIGSIPATGIFGGAAGDFTGFADRVVAMVVGRKDTENTFHVGFIAGSSRFQVSPIDYFSPNDLVYTRK